MSPLNDSQDMSSSTESSSRVLVALIVAAIAIPFLLRWPLLETRGFNPDELVHLHFSWCIAKGLLPYVDYYDVHMPGLHYFMSAFYRFYDVERIPDDAIAFILMARQWMMLFAGATLALTFFLGKVWKDTRTGVVSALLLSYTGFFLSKSLEFRPGVPAAALLVAAVLLALTGVRRSNRGEPGAAWRLFASGAALGVATFLTQKTLFVGPGFAIMTAWFVFDRRLETNRARRFTLVVLQTAGFLVPLVLALGYFATRGASWEFFYYNFIVTTQYPGWSAGPITMELFRQDPVFVVLALAGLALRAPASFARDGAERGEPVVWLAAFSMIATLPLHPAIVFQHFLLVLPLASLYAAWALVEVVGRLPRVPVRDAALAAAVILLGVQPLARLRASFDRGNWGTLQGIRYVLRNTAPYETTLDGFTGLGLFRPQAFYHHFHHQHAYELQTEEERRETADALLEGRVVPKLVFDTHYLRDGTSPELMAFVNEHYVTAGIEPIRIRPFDNGHRWWTDTEPRYVGWDPEQPKTMAHLFFDDRWRVPSDEFGAAVRRTRTRAATLTVPIRRPTNFTAVFRAHADKESLPFAVELVVNGHGAGVVEAAARWQDYEFPVSIRHLRPGFNEFELRFSTANDDERKRLELAVNYFQLVP